MNSVEFPRTCPMCRKQVCTCPPGPGKVTK